MPLFALGECLKQPEAMRDSCTCRLAKLLNLSFAEFHDYFVNSCLSVSLLQHYLNPY